MQSGHRKLLALRWFGIKHCADFRSHPRVPSPMPNVPFWLAKQHYAGLRRTAFDDVERDAIARVIRVPLRLADTDEETLAVWRSTWRDAHPSGFGNWNWERILRRAWRRPSAFHVAVWSGEQLCGLGVGRLFQTPPDRGPAHDLPAFRRECPQRRASAPPYDSSAGHLRC